MTLKLNFKTFVKNNQTRKLSKTWHTMIAEKEVARNNYLATGDIKRAKRFASKVTHLETITPSYTSVQPTVIFTKEMAKDYLPAFNAYFSS